VKVDTTNLFYCYDCEVIIDSPLKKVECPVCKEEATHTGTSEQRGSER
jgi:hypothetical protein